MKQFDYQEVEVDNLTSSNEEAMYNLGQKYEELVKVRNHAFAATYQDYSLLYGNTYNFRYELIYVE